MISRPFQPCRRMVSFSALALLALSAAPATAAPSEGVIAASAPSSLSANSKAELARFLAIPATLKAVTATDLKLSRVAAGSLDRLLLWNEIALDTVAIDHTPLAPGSTQNPLIFGEQFGPHRSSRVMAIVQIAVFDAVNATDPRFKSYTALAPVSGTVSVDAAIARAAHDTLVWIYPYQKDRLDSLYAQDQLLIGGDPAAIKAGAKLGAKSAAAIIKKRTNDGSELPEQSVGTGPDDFHVTTGPGYWSPDPVSGITLAIGSRWAQVKPFVLASTDQYRLAPPPALTSAVYAKAYKQVKTLGGDPAQGTSTTRTAKQTFIGRFWGYDGTPSLCAPPRLYNQVARTVAIQGGITNTTEFARYLAIVNTAMADAAMTAWDSKWHYQFWRPVTGIRGGADDGNTATVGDTAWYPIGAPATNTAGPNFTPPFPAYPSGHATIGGALFETIRIFFPDMTKFTFISDEYNGLNYDADGSVRPLLPQKFKSLSQAESDNAQSRIYNGVHWQFDATLGVDAGHSVARYVMNHAFQRVAQ